VGTVDRALSDKSGVICKTLTRKVSGRGLTSHHRAVLELERLATGEVKSLLI
jgi:hypothetical protein